MKANMKIFYITPEVFPFSPSTNLSDASSALPKYLKSQGHDIRVMMPNYRSVNERKYVLRDVIRLQGLKIDIGDEVIEASGKSAFIPNSKVQIYFLSNRELFNGEDMHCDSTAGAQYAENAKRFIFFSIGCLETLKLLYWQPDVIHCNDWQTALIPTLLKTVYAEDPFFKGTKTLLSFHNPMRCGLFDSSVIKLTGIQESVLGADNDIVSDNKFNFLRAGLAYADLANVSSACSMKFPAPGIGSALESLGVIQSGVDTQVWNSGTDKLIAANYTLDDLSGKQENKRELLAHFELTESNDLPIVGVILGEKDGPAVDFLLSAIEDIVELNVRLIIAGTSDLINKDKIEAFRDKYPAKIGTDWKVDHKLTHLITAGSDLLLMPLTTEPSGLSQMYGQLYGAIPIAFSEAAGHCTQQFNVESGTGTGFLCPNVDSKEMVATLAEAVSVYENKDAWLTLTKNAMSRELSWSEPGEAYHALYSQLMNNKGSRK